jgi:CheY-like chemotaxis protein
MKNGQVKDGVGTRADGIVIYAVDDEPMLLELVTMVLEPHGFAVEVFRDPARALERFSTAEPAPALVITDYSMHTMTGLHLMDACRRIRPGQRVLLTSGTVGASVFAQRAAKPDRFLAKPYSAEELVSAVESLLCLSLN